MLLLALLVACGGDPAPTSSGLVLAVEPDHLLVQHDVATDRVAAEAELYAAATPLDGIAPGDTVDLWVTRNEQGHGTITALHETGTASLPAHHKVGGYPVTGTVVREEPLRLVVDHDPIDGFMGAMVMPFWVGPGTTDTVDAGDRITGTVHVTDYGYWLLDVSATAREHDVTLDGREPLQPGQILPPVDIPVEGGTVRVGAGQDRPTVVTFLYTTCPDPNFCPAIVTRLQALQPRLDGARIVAVTIDPTVDTDEVLADYAKAVGADPARWVFARLDPALLHPLAQSAGLTVARKSGRITHNVRFLVLDRDGRLVKRLDDHEWPLEEMVEALR